MAKKRFHLGAVLSIVTGRVFALNGMAGVYEILNFMTQDNLFTHQLPRVADECKPYLLKQFPKLATVDASGVDATNLRAWLTDQVLLHGEELEVEQLPPGEHYYIDPMSELAEKVHPGRIQVLKVQKPDGQS